MTETLLRLSTFLVGLAGMGCLALAQKPHWERALGSRLYVPARARVLRWLGSVALGLALVICLRIDSPSLAVLVWLMMLMISAVSVAFLIAYLPRPNASTTARRR